MKTFSRGLILLSLISLGVAAPVAAMPLRPELELTTLDGGHFSLAAQRGHWVLINDWATWCAPCIRELPVLSAFAKAHPDKVRVVGVAYDDSEDAEVRRFLQQHPVNYPVARVGLDHPPADFDAPKALPMSWLIAPDGRVVKRFLGPLTRAGLEASIRGGT